jgi:MYXO-CTERM domain-containing protein
VLDTGSTEAPTARSTALAFRRAALVAAPVLAGLLAIGGALADPGVDLDGAAMYERYAENPGPLQWKSVLYHFSYAVWGLAALMLAGAVRRRGSWIANVAGILAFLGISSMPGFLIVDFYDSAIGQVVGVEGTLDVNDRIAGMWGLAVMGGSGTIGFLLCLPVAALAAWRAGLVPWWGAVAPVAGIGLGLMVVGANVPGWAVTTVGFAVLSVALARGTRSDDARPIATPSGD